MVDRVVEVDAKVSVVPTLSSSSGARSRPPPKRRRVRPSARLPEAADLLTPTPHRTATRAFTATLVAALTFALVATPAQAAPAPAAKYSWCSLSQRDHDPPGRTSAYALQVYAKRVSCPAAIAVMKGFHRCRTESWYRCPRKVLGRWRCTGWKRPSGKPRFSGRFVCASGRRRVKSRYEQDTPACFGAAARDPRRRCFSRARTVWPPLGHSDPEPFWNCDQVSVQGACVWGAGPGRAVRHVALVGDSHVHHWQVPLTIAADALRWRGYSLFEGGCFLNSAVGSFSPGCLSFYNGVIDWLQRHPEVDTVFVTQNADTPVAAPGMTPREAKIDGFKRAWRALPKTVRHVVVLRDTTVTTHAVLDCVGRAVADATRRLAPLCPLARSQALREDMAVAAVGELDAPRYAAIDLSDQICSHRMCYPVVGGTIVNADVWGHLNLTFARTLGPFVLRDARRLAATW